MNAPEKLHLPDVQASEDLRQLAIQRVGVRGLRYPLRFLDRDGQIQHTVATLEMTVFLPPEVKGTHMSRFVEVLEADRAALDLEGLRGMICETLIHLGATAGRMEMCFPFFMRKRAPVSGVESLLDMDATVTVEKAFGRDAELSIKVVVPVTSLCPCSKKISDYGAHNQRSHVTVTTITNDHLWIEELVQMIEEQASCELYGLLKRPDEKYVTERAYDNPKFVEDMVRDVAGVMNREARIDAYVVESENFESIHNHSAYALIEHDKRSA